MYQSQYITLFQKKKTLRVALISKSTRQYYFYFLEFYFN